MSGMGLVLRDLSSAADADAFRALNEQWIAAHFELEDEDRRQLADPVAAYVAPGGAVLLAEQDGRVVGCVAVVPDGTGAFELSKMAVAPDARGGGIGRRVLDAGIARAAELGATSLYLGSSTQLPAAVHLYERAGFEHVDRSQLHVPYTRASVWMRLTLPAGAAVAARADAA